MEKLRKLISTMLFAATLGVSGVAQAGIGTLDGVLLPDDGSVADPYEMGVLTLTPKTLFVSVSGAASSTFEEYANFTASNDGGTAVANTYILTINGVNTNEILGLTVEVWDDVHPNGTTLLTTFSGNNTSYSFALTPGGQYHFDISGTLGPNATGGQYSLAVAAVPEPEVYAMLAAGLGLMGFVARRRKQQGAVV